MTGDDQRALLAAMAAERGESLAALSRALRRNDAYLQQYVRRGTPRRLDERDRRFLAAHFGVDEALLGGEPRVADATVAVPELDVAASAGPGTLVEAERVVAMHAFAPALLREAGVSPAQASVVRARGVSMAPTILDGDRLLVDRGDARLVRAPGLFVAALDGDLVVKRLAREGASVQVESDNPAYATRRVPVSEVRVAGRVKLLIRAPR